MEDSLKNPKRQRAGFKGALSRIAAKINDTFLSTASIQILSLLEERVKSNFGEPVEKWDSMLVCLLANKLDANTSKAYHLEHDNCESHKFDKLIKFLETRALAFENSEAVSAASAHAVPAVPGRSQSASCKVSNVVVKDVRCLFYINDQQPLFDSPQSGFRSNNKRLFEEKAMIQNRIASPQSVCIVPRSRGAVRTIRYKTRQRNCLKRCVNANSSVATGCLIENGDHI
ncbi:hypothetical protein ACJJTC_015774 [Scirpophaga incertulas]